MRLAFFKELPIRAVFKMGPYDGGGTTVIRKVDANHGTFVHDGRENTVRFHPDLVVELSQTPGQQ